MPTSNLCRFWCCEDGLDKSKPWGQQNNCQKMFSESYKVGLCVILFLIGCVVVFALCGIFHDLVLGSGPCTTMGGVLFDPTQCMGVALQTLGFYMINLLTVTLEFGIWISCLFFGVETIKHESCKSCLLVVMILFLIPVPAVINSLQGWLVLWIVSGDQSICSLNQMNKFFSLDCAAYGMIIAGIVIGLTMLVICSVNLWTQCSGWLESLRVKRDMERAKLLSNFPV